MAASQPSFPLPVVQGVEFRLIPGWPGYCAGDDGTIWSRYEWRGRSGWRELAGSHNTHRNYTRRLVALCDGGVVVRARVHRLVLEAFVGPCPDGWMCRHLDGNPLNNSLSNLKWGTKAENTADMESHGTVLRGESVGNSKLSDSDADLLRQLRPYVVQSVAAEMFGISRSYVSRVWNGVNRK